MGQYNEDEFLNSYFGSKKNGVVVEIGAAYHDENSNSKFLIDRGWSALLVEPNSIFFNNLSNIYKDNDRIHLENVCAYSENLDSIDFYEYGQLSTLDTSFKERVQIDIDRGADKPHWSHSGNYLKKSIKCLKTSDLLLKYFKDIDFLSIDCEGSDFDVILGIDFDNNNIKLICHEKQNPNQTFRGNGNVDSQISTFLEKNGFVKIFENAGNVFFENIKIKN